MFSTIQIHVHEEDTFVSVNETNTGIALTDARTGSTIASIFFGDSPEEILHNSSAVLDAIMGLRTTVRNE